MTEALYGPTGYYTAGAGAGGFRTSVSAGPAFAGALARLAEQVDAALGRPEPFDVVDVGAGTAGLLGGLSRAAAPELRRRLRLTAVELAPRPPGVPAGVRWSAAVPEITGLLVANEWLDVVPVDVVEEGRLVLVDRSGRERRAGRPAPADLDWLDRWWPDWPRGRAEVGWPRDAAWAGALRRLRRGVAVAVDYAHPRDGRPAAGSLTGFRSGRAVRPVPDGSCDLSAAVALDACAAGAAGADPAGTLLTTQRSALHALGVDGRRPAYAGEPAAYIRSLSAASAAAELLDPGGLGGFGWLVQAVDCPLPPALDRLRGA
jgi:SAM-dependent MidA family methyltransferase